MIGLAILLAVVWAAYASGYINGKECEFMLRCPGKEFPYLLVSIPVLAGLLTWNILIGLLVLVVFYMVLDPLRNKSEGASFFEKSERYGWKYLVTGHAGLYDVINGRIALMIEVFLVIVLISEISIT